MRITRHFRERIQDRIAAAAGKDLFGKEITAMANFLVKKAQASTEAVTYLGSNGKERYLIITIDGAEWGVGVDSAEKIATTLLNPAMLRRDRKRAKLYARLPRRAA